MKYEVETTRRFDSDFSRLYDYTQKILKGWIVQNLVNGEDPFSMGKALLDNRRDLRQYRIGDHRLICYIKGDKIIILALSISNAK